MKKLFSTIAIVLITVFSIKAQETVTPQPQDNPNAPEITFESLVHDYGTIKMGANGECEFKFKNTGKEPLIISNCRASCGCTVPVCPKEPILPGKSDVIKVTYNTSRAGVINKSITITSNAKTANAILTIKGNVIEEQKPIVPEQPVNDGSTPVNK